MPATAKKLRCY